MRPKTLTYWFVLFGLLLYPPAHAHAYAHPNPALNEQVLELPGDPLHPVLLQVTLMEPNGSGPFPLAVLNHGKAVGNPRFAPRYRSVYAARYFLSRGYAVALPMMRGFAGSGGTFRPSCSAEADGIHEARDIIAVIEDLSKRKEIDTHRIVVFGQSYGGWNSLALGALNYPGVKGIIDFAGGRKAPTCGDWQDDLAAAAGAFGGLTKVPSIWFYGNNDAIFPTPVWRAMYRNYTAAGGKAQLVAYGRFLNNSHNFLGDIEALPIWIPKVDAFLARIGLPSRDLHPSLLPAPYPKPTHFAALDDVRAVPNLNRQGRQSYRAFLRIKVRPRVFLLGRKIIVTTNGGYDPLARGLKLCRQAGHRCWPYAVDDQVVWPFRHMVIPPPSHYAKLDNIAAVPYVNVVGRNGYRRFLTLPLPRVFVIAPDGAWDFGARGFDPLARTLALCRKRNTDCHPYAVNNHVVWRGE
ncbi:MAG: hypothetical protein B7Z66_11040 [Chromatiales bacterium 21-64-14]|nr:MAG: hypothetical protein B7Z66_11040 [Chromatiales bacterium 21-64-14]HQU17266.1 CocE/NonD family hydrolase [Gammaproteobacteria bacterium]